MTLEEIEKLANFRTNVMCGILKKCAGELISMKTLETMVDMAYETIGSKGIGSDDARPALKCFFATALTTMMAEHKSKFDEAAHYLDGEYIESLERFSYTEYVHICRALERGIGAKVVSCDLPLSRRLAEPDLDEYPAIVSLRFETDWYGSHCGGYDVDACIDGIEDPQYAVARHLYMVGHGVDKDDRIPPKLIKMLKKCDYRILFAGTDYERILSMAEGME